MNILDRLQGKKKTDPMAEVSATAVAHLREQNLKFQKFMYERLQEVEDSFSYDQQRLSAPEPGPAVEDLDADAFEAGADDFSEFGLEDDDISGGEAEAARVSLEAGVSLTQADVVAPPADEGAVLEAEDILPEPDSDAPPARDPAAEDNIEATAAGEEPPGWANLLGLAGPPATGEAVDDEADAADEGADAETADENETDVEAQAPVVEQDEEKIEVEKAEIYPEKADVEEQKSDIEAQEADVEEQKSDIEAQEADVEEQKSDIEAQKADVEAAPERPPTPTWPAPEPDGGEKTAEEPPASGEGVAPAAPGEAAMMPAAVEPAGEPPVSDEGVTPVAPAAPGEVASGSLLWDWRSVAADEAGDDETGPAAAGSLLAPEGERGEDGPEMPAAGGGAGFDPFQTPEPEGDILAGPPVRQAGDEGADPGETGPSVAVADETEAPDETAGEEKFSLLADEEEQALSPDIPLPDELDEYD